MFRKHKMKGNHKNSFFTKTPVDQLEDSKVTHLFITKEKKF